MKIFVTTVIASAIVASGIIGGGYFVAKAKMADRYVTVKGVAEQNVTADLAVWPIRFTVTGNDLVKIQGKIEENTEIIKKFVKSYGVEEELTLSRPDITDMQAQAYNQNNNYKERFIINQSVVLRTSNVEAVSKMVGNLGDLLKQGIVLNDYNGPRYLYTKLNDIKPAMIAEATRNARKGAEQFAKDSNSPISGIRRANQGIFTILPRNSDESYNEESEKDKRVRVVSTIEYTLGCK